LLLTTWIVGRKQVEVRARGPADIYSGVNVIADDSRMRAQMPAVKSSSDLPGPETLLSVRDGTFPVARISGVPLAFSPDSRFLAMASDDLLKTYDVSRTSPSLIRQLGRAAREILDVAFANGVVWLGARNRVVVRDLTSNVTPFEQSPPHHPTPNSCDLA
jgi:hypothetical protein